MKRINAILLALLVPFLLSAGGVKEKHSYIKITTKFGTATVMLYNETPGHRDNILKLAKEHFYDSLTFHRVIHNFMIQGGDPQSKNAPSDKVLGSGGLEYTIPAEINEKFIHKKGVIAAARTTNPQKASSSCQFYLVQGKRYKYDELDTNKYTKEQIDTYVTLGGVPFLDNNYTVYGEIVDGIEMVDRVAAVKTGLADKPLENVYMKVEVLDAKASAKWDKKLSKKK